MAYSTVVAILYIVYSIFSIQYHIVYSSTSATGTRIIIYSSTTDTSY